MAQGSSEVFLGFVEQEILVQRLDFGDESHYNTISVLNLKHSNLLRDNLSDLPKFYQFDNICMYVAFYSLREAFDELLILHFYTK